MEACPKCGTARRDEPACPTCGLRADKMAGFAAIRDAGIPAVVLAAWQRVLDDWSMPARHDELLGLVSQHDCYPWVAGRYREEARARPGDEIATAQLARLSRAAEATLFATATVRRDPGSKPFRATILVVVLLVTVVSVGLIYLMVMRGREPTQPPPPGAQVR